MVKIENGKGSISISAEVFTNIAGDAATRCFGVKGMAGKSKESGLYQLLRRESMSKGVTVGFDEDGRAVIGLHIVVDGGVDSGPVLARERIPIEPGSSEDELHDRIKLVERRILARVIRDIADGTISLEEYA